MKTVYVIIPFTANYGRPIEEKLQVFNKRADAVKYGDDFKYVEMVTTKLR